MYNFSRTKPPNAHYCIPVNIFGEILEKFWRIFTLSREILETFERSIQEKLPKWFHTFVNSSIYSPEFPQISPQLENKLQCFSKFTRHKMYKNLNPKSLLSFSVVFFSCFFCCFFLLSFSTFSLDLLGAKV